MSKVHVFTDPDERYRLDGARKYGEVIYHDLPNPWKTGKFLSAIEAIDFDDDDFIALTGPMLSVVFGVIGILLNTDVSIKLLLFNARNDSYEVRTIE